MKFLYYLPAIGENNLEEKYNILIHNLEYIYNNINETFDLCINFYTISDYIKLKLKTLPFINNLYIYEKKGVLTELFLTNPNNIYISNYDYILFILDDVKIMNIDIKQMIEIKEKYHIEFISSKILKSSRSFMNNNYNDLTINNFLEVYLLLFTPIDFNKFCSIHTIKNKWMWGVDFLFGYYNIRVGILHKYIAKHVLQSNSNIHEARVLMDDYLKTYTKYKCMNEIFDDFSAIKETINFNI